jgi:PiT family inorganic phosphate transporter
MGQIAMSWLVSPFLGGLLAFLSFLGIRRFILHSTDPVAATRRTSPYIVGVVVAVIVLSFIYKVLQSRMEAPPLVLSLTAASAAGVVAAVFTTALVRNTAPRPGASSYDYVERIFALLQIATACFVAFAHGANDVANAVGPLSAVVTLAQDGFATVATEVAVPFWVLVLGGGGIVLGLATYGYRVIATIGSAITEVTPTRGFSAEFGAATTVLIASSMGLPISTTHTLVGGVIGVGVAQGIGALNLRVVRNIVGSWIATVPVAAGIAMLLLWLGRAVLL